MSEVLAHQGGWDEILLVLGPILVLGALLMLANRRADKVSAGSDRSSDDVGSERS